MKIWIRKILGFGLASFFGDFSHEMTIALIPTLVMQLVGAVWSPLALGVIASLSELNASGFRIISGLLADRVTAKKPLIMLGYTVSALFSTLVGFAHSIGSLSCYRIISYIGSGLREPPRDALIAASINAQEYGRAFGLKNSMDTLGALIGPLVAVVCLSFVTVKTVFILSCIPGMLAVVSIAFLTSEAPVSTTVKRDISFRAFWDDIALLPRSFLVLVGIFCLFDIGCFNKLLLIARTQEMMGYESAAVVTFLYAVFNMIRAMSEIIIGFASDYIPRMLLLAVCGYGVFAIVASLLLVPHASLIYCAGVFILAGVSAAAVFTLKKASAADILPPDVRGIGYGVLQAAEGISTLIANVIIGLLWTLSGPQVGFSYVLVISLCAIVVLSYVRYRGYVS